MVLLLCFYGASLVSSNDCSLFTHCRVGMLKFTDLKGWKIPPLDKTLTCMYVPSLCLCECLCYCLVCIFVFMCL